MPSRAALWAVGSYPGWSADHAALRKWKENELWLQPRKGAWRWSGVLVLFLVGIISALYTRVHRNTPEQYKYRHQKVDLWGSRRARRCGTKPGAMMAPGDSSGVVLPPHSFVGKYFFTRIFVSCSELSLFSMILANFYKMMIYFPFIPATKCFVLRWLIFKWAIAADTKLLTDPLEFSLLWLKEQPFWKKTHLWEII